MAQTEEKSAWQIIEDEARKRENVDDDFSLRWAKIDYEDEADSVEYAEYRLRKMSGENEGEERTGKIENYAAIRP